MMVDFRLSLIGHIIKLTSSDPVTQNISDMMTVLSFSPDCIFIVRAKDDELFSLTIFFSIVYTHVPFHFRIFSSSSNIFGYWFLIHMRYASFWLSGGMFDVISVSISFEYILSLISYGVPNVSKNDMMYDHDCVVLISIHDASFLVFVPEMLAISHDTMICDHSGNDRSFHWKLFNHIAHHSLSSEVEVMNWAVILQVIFLKL